MDGPGSAVFLSYRRQDTAHVAGRIADRLTTTMIPAVSVAAGVFAPGHLGELTRYLPVELVDDVLAQTRTVQQRVRPLPSRTGV